MQQAVKRLNLPVWWDLYCYCCGYSRLWRGEKVKGTISPSSFIFHLSSPILSSRLLIQIALETK